MRSHWAGRYSSEVNEAGTKASEEAGPLDECLQGVWWHTMRESGAGVESRPEQFRDYRIGVYDDLSWEYPLQWGHIFIVNINDDMRADPEKYKEQHEVMVSHLNKAFPEPTATVAAPAANVEQNPSAIYVDDPRGVPAVLLADDPHPAMSLEASRPSSRTIHKAFRPSSRTIRDAEPLAELPVVVSRQSQGAAPTRRHVLRGSTSPRQAAEVWEVAD